MQKLNPLSIDALICTLLAATGLSLLLHPALVSHLGINPAWFGIPAGASLLLFAWVILWRNWFPASRWKPLFFYAINLATVGAAAIFTYHIGLLLISGVLTALFISQWLPRQQTAWAGVLLNAAMTVFCLLPASQPAVLAAFSIPPYTYLAAGAFALAAILQLRLIRRPLPIWETRRSNLFTALPWLALSILWAVAPFEWLNWLPAAAVTLFFLFCADVNLLNVQVPASKWIGREILLSIFLIYSIGLGANIWLLVRLTAISQAPPQLHVHMLVFWAFTWLALNCLICWQNIVLNQMYSRLMQISQVKDIQDLENLEMRPLPGTRSEMEIPLFQEITTSLRSILRQSEQTALSAQQSTGQEKLMRSRMACLNEILTQLTDTLDPPVSAQIMVTALQRTLKCSLVCVMTYSTEAQRPGLIPLAAYGPNAHQVRAMHRINAHKGLIGQAIKSGRTVLNHRPGQTVGFGGLEYPSALIVPLTHRASLQAVILAFDANAEALTHDDIPFLEAAGAQLLSAWDRHSHTRNLITMMQANLAYANFQSLDQLLDKVAETTRQTLAAQFVAVATNRQGKWQIKYSGQAMELLTSIRNHQDTLLSELARTPSSFRLRDIRRHPMGQHLLLDSLDMRSMLVSPITLYNAPTGVILAFGKISDISFTENDLFLSDLLASQAAAAIESHLLNQELRLNLKSMQLLYALSLKLNQVDSLQEAAQHVTDTAHQLCKATCSGLQLFDTNGQLAADIYLPAENRQDCRPTNLIHLVMSSQLPAAETVEYNQTIVCFPILTPQRCYGGLWLQINENDDLRTTEDLRLLINQASIGLERVYLLEETRHQARELRQMLVQLEESYNETLVALTTALDARDRETEGHSLRVAQLSSALGQAMNLSAKELHALQLGALLHDIGKIGISDTILNKPGPLTLHEWEIMRQHPAIGARIIQPTPFLRDAIPVVACHHERWDGSGYPQGLSGKDIPLLARIFAAVDIFDALTSDRPYRKRIETAEAIQYIGLQAGKQLDPQVTAKLKQVLEDSQTLQVAEFSHEEKV